jgi:hypothetical protein
MKPAATFGRIVACVVICGGLVAPVVAHAETESSTEAKLARMLMPGQPFRQRNKLSLNAVTALGLIMRTENVEDPTYVAARKVVSDQVAVIMKLDAAQLHASWGRAPRDHQIAVLAAITQLNVRYVEGKEDPYVQMDCSGLQWYAWRIAGVDAPRQAVSQLDRHMRVERKDAIVGDIAGEGTHVQMYLGQGLAFIHAPFNGKRVLFKTMGPEQAARVVWTNPSNIATYRL